MIRRITLCAVLALVIAGCAAPVPPPSPTTQAIQDAQRSYAQGEFGVAARIYLELASQASPPSREDLQLRAADALIRAQQLPQARQLIATAAQTSSDPLLQSRARLLSARIALAERHGDQALSLLSAPLPAQADNATRAEYHGLRADAFTLIGNRLETARELVKREPFLTSEDDIRSNQHAIWQALAMLTTRALQQLRTEPPPDVLSGWMALVEIAKTYQLHPAQLKQQIEQWRQQYPAHPVLPEILAALQTRRQEEVAYPDRIALLLPLSSKFAEAADALRDGFIAAYYAHHPNPAQVVRIYDVGSGATDVQSVYDRAVSDGAQFIVGPLDKDAVNVLAQQKALPVPTLALNYSEDLPSYPANLYQFSLSPEDEAHQVAERVWLDGHVYAAALVPAGSWGDRVYSAFDERWRQLGGHVLDVQTYNPNESDFSAPIRRMLSIDESRARDRALENVLKRDLKFTARRRQDIDFIFMAAYPRQARLIRPQLKFYHAADVPVYATSHIYTGTVNPEMDRDLDGVIFGDMPWVLSEESGRHGIRAEVERYISPAGRSLQRLYALGIDAFDVIAALRPLKEYPYERFDGETGSLSLDANNRLRRQLTWVRFRGGRPALLDAQD